MNLSEMGVKRKIFAVVGVLALVFLTVAGVGGYFGYVKFLKPVLAYRKAAETIVEYKTAHFETRASYVVGAGEGELYQEVDVVMDGEGDVDMENRLLSLDMTISMLDQEVEMSEVIAGDDLYLSIDGGEFEKVSISELEEQSGMTIDSFREDQIWANNIDADYEYVGEKEVDGELYYVYTIALSSSDLQDMIDEMVASMADSGLTVLSDDITVGNITTEVWVNPRDSMPAKERIEIEEIKLKTDMGDIVIKDMVMEFTYSDINESVDITIPGV